MRHRHFAAGLFLHFAASFVGILFAVSISLFISLAGSFISRPSISRPSIEGSAHSPEPIPRLFWACLLLEPALPEWLVRRRAFKRPRFEAFCNLVSGSRGTTSRCCLRLFIPGLTFLALSVVFLALAGSRRSGSCRPALPALAPASVRERFETQCPLSLSWSPSRGVGAPERLERSSPARVALSSARRGSSFAARSFCGAANECSSVQRPVVAGPRWSGCDSWRHRRASGHRRPPFAAAGARSRFPRAEFHARFAVPR